MSDKPNFSVFETGHIIVRNARISFPNLHEKAEFEGKKTKYAGKFLFYKDEHKDAIAEVKKLINKCLTENKQIKKVDGKSKSMLAKDKICFTDGDADGGREEYENAMVLSASNPKKPVVLHMNGTKVDDPDDCRIYSGCRVNVKFSFWFQDHKTFGKRINANLVTVQFVGDDEPFSGIAVSEDEAVDGFEDLGGDDVEDEVDTEGEGEGEGDGEGDGEDWLS